MTVTFVVAPSIVSIVEQYGNGGFCSESSIPEPQPTNSALSEILIQLAFPSLVIWRPICFQQRGQIATRKKRVVV